MSAVLLAVTLVPLVGTSFSLLATLFRHLSAADNTGSASTNAVVIVLAVCALSLPPLLIAYLAQQTWLFANVLETSDTATPAETAPLAVENKQANANS